MECDANYVFFPFMIFIMLKLFPSVPSFKCFYHEIMLNLSNAFYASVETVMRFIFPSCSQCVILHRVIFLMLNYLGTLHKSHFAMVYNCFNALLELVCWHLIEDFFINIQKVYWSVVSFSCGGIENIVLLAS